MLHNPIPSSGITVTSRPVPEDALALAKRRFLDAQRIDMSALADELGVNRVTLYRWFGSRDGLLVEAIWSLTERTLSSVAAEQDGVGGERVVAVVVEFLRRVIESPGMQRWLNEEGNTPCGCSPATRPAFSPG